MKKMLFSVFVITMIFAMGAPFLYAQELSALAGDGHQQCSMSANASQNDTVCPVSQNGDKVCNNCSIQRKGSRFLGYYMVQSCPVKNSQNQREQSKKQ